MDKLYTINKIAAITITFWIAKVIATTLGETEGDFIAQTLGYGYVIGFAITAALLAVILTAQIASNTYHAGLFWAAIVATTTAGTEISDMMVHSFSAGPVVGASLLVSGLIAVLAFWYIRKRTIDVDRIADKESEIFFWVAVVFSNSLGTAFGDSLVDPIGLSYVEGAVVCATLIVLILLLHYGTKINAALLFWAAFIFTRPFGATFGNFLTKTPERGGLDLGTLQTSLVAGAFLVLVVMVGSRLAVPRHALLRKV